RHRVGAVTTRAVRPRRAESSHHNLVRFALKCLPPRAAARVVIGELLRLPRHPRAVAGGLLAVARELPEIARLRRRLRPRAELVAQRVPVPTIRALARSRTRTVYDLYDPVTIENLALDAGRPLGRAERAYFGLGTLVQKAVLAHGDAFVCASETQRDLWLGALLVLGRIDHRAYGDDPTL